jgi:predicted O-methyltransferase YrrM
MPAIGAAPLNPDELYQARPRWAEGSTGTHFDMRFLFDRALVCAAPVTVEIGTASGFGTVFLCHALESAYRDGRVGAGYRVITYDAHPRFYADETKRVGDAARELLPEPLLDHLEFRAPAQAMNLRHDFGDDSIGFMFLDANHSHPWPVLDLLFALDSLAPGAEVVMHDINLPVRMPGQGSGVKYVYDGLDIEKWSDEADPIPNIGSVRIPPDKKSLRAQLVAIAGAHEWEDDLPEAFTSQVLPEESPARSPASPSPIPDRRRRTRSFFSRTRRRRGQSDIS